MQQYSKKCFILKNSEVCYGACVRMQKNIMPQRTQYSARHAYNESKERSETLKGLRTIQGGKHAQAIYVPCTCSCVKSNSMGNRQPTEHRQIVFKGFPLFYIGNIKLAYLIK